MYYDCPLSVRRRRRSTKVPTSKPRTEAERKTLEWEEQLRSGKDAPPSQLTWADYRKRFTQHHLEGAAAKKVAAYDCALNALERLVRPNRPGT